MQWTEARLHARHPVLAFAAGASVLGYVALFVLSQSSALRLIATPLSDEWPWHAAIAALLSPIELARTQWNSAEGLTHIFAFGLSVTAVVAAWAWMLWLARPGAGSVRLRTIVATVLLCSVPLLGLVSLFSSDLYLYAFYGRMVATYGRNPLLTLPNEFWDDPHMWVLAWPDLPAAYGPLWLMVSSALSWIAGESLAANVVVYKVAGLLVHLLTTILLWHLLRRDAPERAAWGTVFYGLNPLALFEIVGNGHNDGLTALLSIAALLAVAGRRERVGSVLIGAAVMTKAIAVVLLVPVLAAVALARRGARARAAAVGGILTVLVATLLLLYLPFWAGTAIVDNIRANPASQEYLNSVWQLLRTGPVMTPDERFVSLGEHLALLALLGGCLLVVVEGMRKGCPLADALAWTWLAFCASLSWVWPWYFVPLCALAAAAGPGRVAWLTGGVTLGGLLFWMGWIGPPHPSAPWLFTHRALVFFGPAMAIGAVQLCAGAASLSRQLARSRLRGVLASTTRSRSDLESLDA